MAKVELTPIQLMEWKKELRRSIDEQVPLPRCLNTKNMLAMVEEISVLNRALREMAWDLYGINFPSQEIEATVQTMIAKARKQLESEAGQ